MVCAVGYLKTSSEDLHLEEDEIEVDPGLGRCGLRESRVD